MSQSIDPIYGLILFLSHVFAFIDSFMCVFLSRSKVDTMKKISLAWIIFALDEFKYLLSESQLFFENAALVR
jgi:hypothetical protein